MDLYEYWADRPPVHEIAAALAGVKPQPKPADKGARPDPGISLAELHKAIASRKGAP